RSDLHSFPTRRSSDLAFRSAPGKLASSLRQIGGSSCPRARTPTLPRGVPGQQATFTFDGNPLAGTLQSRTAVRLIKEWATAHRPELEANWNRLKAGEPLERIAPLD